VTERKSALKMIRRRLIRTRFSPKVRRKVKSSGARMTRLMITLCSP